MGRPSAHLTAARRRGAYGLRACLIGAILVTLAVTGSALAEQTATLIVTGRTDRFYPAMTSGLETHPADAFEEELARLRDAHPDALLIEAGEFLSVSYGLETAYSHPAIALRDRFDYDVVNLTARDAAMGTVGNIAYHVSDEESRERVISGIKSSQPKDLDLPSAKEVDSPGGMSLTFISFPHLDNASGLVGKTQYMELKQAESAWEIGNARRNERVAVAISEVQDEDLIKVLEGVGHPDLVLDWAPVDGRIVRRQGETWFVATPRTGQILTLNLRRSEGGELEEPHVEVVDFHEDTEWDALYDFPVPRLGFSIPNIHTVVAVFLSADPEAVRVDRVPMEEAARELTVLEEAAVYHVNIDGEKLRLYRLFSEMSYFGPGESLTNDPGWPIMDMVVALDSEHRLNRVINRTRFPVGLAPTTLTESLNRLAGRDPDEWRPDRETAAGLEPLWHWATTDIRRTIELDRLIYGE